MKNIFKIHALTYLILLSVLLSGYFNYFLVIFLILLFHDLGHVIMIKLLKYKMSKINILPFGSIIDTNIKPNSNSVHILLISVAGVIMQLIVMPIFPFLLNEINYSIYIKYNFIILIFNLLPIIPLDGSKIIQALFENIFSYKKALYSVNIISIISIVLFFIFLNYYAMNAYIVIIFLIYKTYEIMTNHKYIFNGFLLDRFLNTNQNKHVKYISSINKIYKNRYNFVGKISEDKALKLYFKL